MQNEPKLSVIVPVYNTEKHLSDCLDSLLAQTYKNIEVICVDDGSTDNSAKILNQYAQKDARIKIISQEDLGQGIAKNNGMKIASGKYLVFADSDDWLESTAFETLCNFAEDNSSQVVQFNYTEHDEIAGEKHIISFAEKAMKNYGYDLVATRHYNWRDFKENCFCQFDPHTWSYFYNAQFVRENGIQFAEGRRAEDHLFSFGAILAAEKIDCLNESLYCYRRWNGSATKTRGDDNFSVFDNVERLRNFIVAKGLWDELAEEFHRYEKQIMVWHYNQTPQNRIKEYKAFCKSRISRKEYREVMKQAKDRSGFEKAIRKIAKKCLPNKVQTAVKALCGKNLAAAFLVV